MIGFGRAGIGQRAGLARLGTPSAGACAEPVDSCGQAEHDRGRDRRTSRASHLQPQRGRFAVDASINSIDIVAETINDCAATRRH